MSAVYTAQSLVLCYGSPNKLIQSIRTHLSVPSSTAEMVPELNYVKVHQQRRLHCSGKWPPLWNITDTSEAIVSDLASHGDMLCEVTSCRETYRLA